ncbi:MAG: transglycosylase SLT domain-containing protein [Bdellovibrionales bacterium]|nr:transglycosylase SLT domain-containing protein [Bdellovibrionales bacterium]
MARLRWICCFVFLGALSTACSSHRKAKPHVLADAEHPVPAPSITDTKTPATPEGEVAMTEEDETEDGSGDEEDSSDTEMVEGTPTDLGEVQASDKIPEAEIRADILARKTFPLVENEFVDQWIRYFTGRGRGAFLKWLQRSPRYRPLIQKVMREEGLPEDLVYLAMIESGFNPKAKSRAKAVGPWQFIKSTGQRYGLEVDSWVDERRDIEKSTHAAAKYLRELHQIFGSWYLAAASYNAGEGKVLNAVKRDKSRNFWELARKKKNFRAETRNYAPKIIAAALITRNPAKYGFTDVEYESVLQWETVEVPGGTDLRSVTDITGIPKDTIQLMNAELKRGRTPPNHPYKLHVPLGEAEKVAANLDKIKARKYKVEEEEAPRRRRIARKGGGFAPIKNEAPVPAGSYRVQAGDTLWDLAKKNNTTVAEIKRLNSIRSPRQIRAGLVIKVPVKQ